MFPMLRRHRLVKASWGKWRLSRVVRDGWDFVMRFRGVGGGGIVGAGEAGRDGAGPVTAARCARAAEASCGRSVG